MAENNIDIENSTAVTQNSKQDNKLTTAKPDSKTILRNMEEALNTVKENHRIKQRRRREQKKLALIEAGKANSQKNQNTKAVKDNGELSDANSTPNKLANAFELMMSARKVNVSPNTLNKETNSPKSPAVAQPKNLKHKLVLQEWANRKGEKRRLEEESRAATAQKKMRTRAKRFKNMLLNDSPSTSKKANECSKKSEENKSVSKNVTIKSTSKNDATIDLTIETKNEKPKRVQRRTRSSTLNSTVSVSDISLTEEKRAVGRPKRSCTSKSRYKSDENISNDKTIPDNKNDSNEEKDSDDDILVIDLDACSTPSTPAKQPPPKLAPLFLPRKLDTEALKARQDFLQSGVPEKLRLDMIKQKVFEQSYENLEIFPKISHVQQFNNDERKFIKKLSKIKSKHKLSDDNDEINIINSFSKFRKTIVKKKPTEPIHLDFSLPVLQNKREIIKIWKTHFERFPTFKCYNQMREKYQIGNEMNNAEVSKQLSDSIFLTRIHETQRTTQVPMDDSAIVTQSASFGGVLFSDKYKPLAADEVLVNLTPIQQLREFLANWSEGSQSRDETIDDSDSNSSQLNSQNAVVLVGPSSSGKTCAVYALANEMNFNVLEINAGMKRTGKKLLQELQEATQSHQIRKDKKLNNTKKKITTTVQAESERKSLILIEDADVVFEQTDCGFVDAIYTLAASSKRPLILMASKSTCTHLQRLIEQNSIVFSMQNVYNISKLLSIITLVENCHIDINDLRSLYVYNGKNLRRTLHELQVYIKTGGDSKDATATNSNKSEIVKYKACSNDEIPIIQADQLPVDDNVYKHQDLFNFYICNQNIKQHIPSPIDFTLLQINLNNIFHSSKLFTEAMKPVKKRRYIGKMRKRNTNKPAEIVSKFYDNISCAILIGCTRIENVFGTINTELETDNLTPNLSKEIAHYLVENSVIKQLKVDNLSYNLCNWTAHRESLSDVLMLTGRQPRSLDYDPLLRQISRTERERKTVEKRFHHYLRHYSPNNDTTRFDKAADIFQEPLNKTD